MTRIDHAKALATEAHAGQVDKLGVAYIEHPTAVAEALRSQYENQPWPYTEFSLEDLICAAYLHDVVEDTPITLDYIEQEFGLPVRIIVDGVTRREETYSDFVRRSKRHAGSRIVKRADLHHNMGRISALPQEQQQKLLARYQQAQQILGEENKEAK